MLALEAPVTLISGGGDGRAGAEWMRALEAGGLEVRLIPGVDHFLDLAHAPKLLDEVMRVIKEVKHG